MESEVDIQNLCRLCGEGKSRLHNIDVLEKDKKYPLGKIFADILRIERKSGDGLPKRICKPCTSTVLQVYKIVEQFRDTDVRLREHLQSIIESEKVDIKPTSLVEIDDSHMEDELVIEPPEIKKEVSENLEQNNEDKGTGDVGPTRERINSPVEKRKSSKKLDKNTPRKKKRPLRLRLSRRDLKHPGRPRLNDFKCYICKSESLGSGQALLTHLHSHSDLLPYTCTDCVMETVVIEGVTTLNIHRRMHENPYKCNHCDRRYTTEGNLTLHVQNFHLAQSARCPSTCEICGRVYSSKHALKMHQMIHVHPMTCEQCGKAFSHPNKLRRHIEIAHEGFKRYHCQYCPKTLRSLDGIQFHVESKHSGIQLKCSYCSRKCSSKLMLRSHEKKHEDDPNYKAPQSWKEYYVQLDGAEEGFCLCKICGVKVKAIAWHMRSAHFQTDYNCEICGAVFKKKQTYDGHIQAHIFGKEFRCIICGRGFSTKDLLLTHLKTKKHRDDPMAQDLEWLDDLAEEIKEKRKSISIESVPDGNSGSGSC
ncbi:zinc finger protein draculin-like [Malaya genurostris]|uniref:zinc finger protein draculin-like n=1 Tax=Malaya genurostris TaxID=325434 RepID=UPI0026F3FA74|nr:zinc finger protein draculin-like [Malaya genurostris]